MKRFRPSRSVASRYPFYSSLLILLIILAVIPITVLTNKQPQISTQNAQVPPSPQPLGATGNWGMIFDDEFNGTTLDTTKWSVCYSWDCHSGGNGELMVYAPQYATLSNGILTIKAVNQQTCDGGYCAKYGSSLIQTGKGFGGSPSKFTFTYGFAEARLQVPYGTGYFPAFWLLSPQSEIDLMEVFGNKTNFNCGVFLNHYKSHWPCQSHGTNTVGSYHTFGVDWEPTQMTFYYDGTPVGTTTDPTKIPPDAAYILLNFAIGANFLTPPDSTTVFPAYLNADYIRVWKSGGTGGIPQPTTHINPTILPTSTPVVPTYGCMGGANCAPTAAPTSLPKTSIIPSNTPNTPIPLSPTLPSNTSKNPNPTSAPSHPDKDLLQNLLALLLGIIQSLLNLIKSLF